MPHLASGSSYTRFVVCGVEGTGSGLPEQGKHRSLRQRRYVGRWSRRGRPTTSAGWQLYTQREEGSQPDEKAPLGGRGHPPLRQQSLAADFFVGRGLGEKNLKNQQAGADDDGAIGHVKSGPLVLADVEE